MIRVDLNFLPVKLKSELDLKQLRHSLQVEMRVRQELYRMLHVMAVEERENKKTFNLIRELQAHFSLPRMSFLSQLGLTSCLPLKTQIEAPKRGIIEFARSIFVDEDE